MVITVLVEEGTCTYERAVVEGRYKQQPTTPTRAVARLQGRGELSARMF